MTATMRARSMGPTRRRRPSLTWPNWGQSCPARAIAPPAATRTPTRISSEESKLMDRVCQNAGRLDPGTSTAPDSYLAGDWSEAGPAGIRHKRGPRMSGTVIDRELPSAEAVDLLD